MAGSIWNSDKKSYHLSQYILSFIALHNSVLVYIPIIVPHHAKVSSALFSAIPSQIVLLKLLWKSGFTKLQSLLW